MEPLEIEGPHGAIYGPIVSTSPLMLVNSERFANFSKTRSLVVILTLLHTAPANKACQSSQSVDFIRELAYIVPSWPELSLWTSIREAQRPCNDDLKLVS